MTNEALRLTSEILRLFVVEALQRAREVALSQEEEEILPDHVEQIMAQLLLDF